MPEPFKPNPRQQALIEAARMAAEQAAGQGHYPPAELVERMTVESQVVADAANAQEFDHRWQSRFHFTAVAIFLNDLPDRDGIAAKLRSAGCIGVETFDAHHSLGTSFSLSFESWAPSGEAALRWAFAAIQAEFPGALVGDFDWPVLDGIEGEAAPSQPGCGGAEAYARGTAAGADFRVTICAAVQQSIPAEALLQFLSPAGCESARCFRRRPGIFIGEFVRFAQTQLDAEESALNALRELFQDWRLANLERAAGSTLDALSVLTKEHWRTPEEIEVAAALLEEVPLRPEEPSATSDGSGDLGWSAGDVFEVLADLQVAHVRMDDGRILALKPNTPGLLDGFGSVRTGQRFQCLTDSQLGVATFAMRLEGRPEVDGLLAACWRAAARKSKKLWSLVGHRR